MQSDIKNNPEGITALYADLIAEKKCVENSLRSAMARYEEVGRLYDVAYEKNVNGLIDDDWFMHLSDKYGKERLELKEKIKKYRERLENLETEKQGKDLFVSAVKKFMQMQTLTAPLIKELIDKIVVYEAEGTGKNKTQKLIIYLIDLMQIMMKVLINLIICFFLHYYK